MEVLYPRCAGLDVHKDTVVWRVSAWCPRARAFGGSHLTVAENDPRAVRMVVGAIGIKAHAAVTDRVAKLIDYAAVPSARCYVLLEQTAIAATVFQRGPGGARTASAHLNGALDLPGPDVTLPLVELYRGLTFSSQKVRAA